MGWRLHRDEYNLHFHLKFALRLTDNVQQSSSKHTHNALKYEDMMTERVAYFLSGYA